MEDLQQRSWYQVKHLFDELETPAPELFTEALEKSLQTLVVTRNSELQISILLFMQEYGNELFSTRRHLRHFMKCCDHLLRNPSGSDVVVQAVVLSTMTCVLISCDCIRAFPRMFEGFVGVLLKYTGDTEATDSYIRKTACECLRELEQCYPHLLMDSSVHMSILAPLVIHFQRRNAKHPPEKDLVEHVFCQRESAELALHCALWGQVGLADLCIAELSCAFSSYVSLLLLFVRHAVVLAMDILDEGYFIYSVTASDQPTTTFHIPKGTVIVSEGRIWSEYPQSQKVARAAFDSSNLFLWSGTGVDSNNLMNRLRHSVGPSSNASSSRKTLDIADVASMVVRRFVGLVLGHVTTLHMFNRVELHRILLILGPLFGSTQENGLTFHLHRLTSSGKPIFRHMSLIHEMVDNGNGPLCGAVSSAGNATYVRFNLVVQHLYQHYTSTPSMQAVCVSWLLGLVRQDKISDDLLCYFSSVRRTWADRRPSVFSCVAACACAMFDVMLSIKREAKKCAVLNEADDIMELAAWTDCFSDAALFSPSSTVQRIVCRLLLQVANEETGKSAMSFAIRLLLKHSITSEFCHGLGVNGHVHRCRLIEMFVQFTSACIASLYKQKTLKEVEHFVAQQLDPIVQYVASSATISLMPLLLPLICYLFTQPRIDIKLLISTLVQFVHRCCDQSQERYSFVALSNDVGGEFHAATGIDETDTTTWATGNAILHCCRTLAQHRSRKDILQPLATLLQTLQSYFPDVWVRSVAGIYFRALTRVGHDEFAQIFSDALNPTYETSHGVLPSKQPDTRLAFNFVSNTANQPFLRVYNCQAYRQSAPSNLRDGGSALIYGDGGESRRSNVLRMEISVDDDVVLHQYFAFIESHYMELSNDVRARGTSQTTNFRHDLKGLHIQIPIHLVMAKTLTALGFPEKAESLSEADATCCTKPSATGAVHEVQCNPRGNASKAFAIHLEFSPSPFYQALTPMVFPFLTELGSLSGLDSSKYGAEVEGKSVTLGFPYVYERTLVLQPILPTPETFSVQAIYTTDANCYVEGLAGTINVKFQDLFLPLPVVTTDSVLETDSLSLRWRIYKLLWFQFGDEPQVAAVTHDNNAAAAASVKVLELEKEVVHEVIRNHLGPFVVCEVASGTTLDATTDNFLMETLGPGLVNATPDRRYFAAIFVPSKFHLLFDIRCFGSQCIIHIRTDRWQMLQHLDEYFESWQTKTGP